MFRFIMDPKGAPGRIPGGKTMNAFTGIHHVALKCGSAEEYEKVTEFYRDFLGLAEIRSWGAGEDAGCMLGAGSDIVEIFASGKTTDGIAGINHFALETVTAADVDEWLDAVRGRGCPVTQEAKDVTIGSLPPMPIRCAFFNGLLGESIELFYVYPG